METLNITKNGYYIKIEKDGSYLAISKSIDNDIWFTSNEELVMIPIFDTSRELPLFNALTSLMQRIMGKFILDEEYKEHSFLPQDFIDFESKIITWHSDNDNNSSLELMYENNCITISLKGDPKKGNSVRIRTNGSEYYYYYQLFEIFYRELLLIAKGIETEEPGNASRTRKKY